MSGRDTRTRLIDIDKSLSLRKSLYLQEIWNLKQIWIRLINAVRSNATFH